MKIPSLTSFATSKTGQRFYKWLCAPDKEKFLNNTLPTVESGIVTVFYVYFTEKQEDIPKDQRTLLNIQNVLMGITGMMAGSFLNKKVSNYGDKLAPLIDKNLVDTHKVVNGLRVALPIVATALIMRLVNPIIATEISARMEQKRRAERDQKLNKIA